MFVFVKWIDGLKKEAEVAEEPAAPELTADQQLLTEIRDILKGRPV